MDDRFWQQTPEQVAQKLTGKTMIFGTILAKIIEAQGYPPMKKKRGVYHAILRMKSGDIYLPDFRSSILLIIVVKGGRILIRSIEVDGEVITGPGRVTKRLGMTQARARGRAEWMNSKNFKIVLSGSSLR